MNVSEAVARRSSTRAFVPDHVSKETVRALLEQTAHAPSCGNPQSWHVHALTGDPLRQLVELVKTNGPDEVLGYTYPQDLGDPYRTRRFRTCEQPYETIPITRKDKAERFAQLARNARFFGAPVGIFLFINREIEPPQWPNLGMYLQNLVLLALERGLAACPQEYWALYSNQVQDFLNVPSDQMLFCGVALGYATETAPVNQLKSGRAASEEWLALHGF